MEKAKNSEGSFTDSQLKGNWGEQYIASLLTAYGCLVRHVGQGHDSGIDLYCESIRNGNPFLHFFVQVKTGYGCMGTEKSFNFKEYPIKKFKERIKYWKKQPVPVFIFLVPDKRGNTEIPFFVGSVLNFKNNNIELNFKINTPKELKSIFLGENDFDGLIINETFRWSLAKGHLSPLPNAKDSKLKKFPVDVMNTTPYFKDVTDTLHNALWRIYEDLLLTILNTEELKFSVKKEGVDRHLLEMEPYMKALEALIKRNKPSHTSKITIGLWHYIKDEKPQAEKWIKQGLKIVKRKLKSEKNPEALETFKRHLANAERYLSTIKERSH